MGACLGGAAPQDEHATKESQAIDAKAAADFRKEQEKVKLLLLGAGESGKSTIFKQMKILHGVITDEDRRLLTPIVYQNTIIAMKTLVAQVEHRNLEGQLRAVDAFETVKSCEESAVIDPPLGKALKEVWNDPVVQGVWEKQAEYQIVESVKFFFDALDRISAADYTATPQDMVYTRVRTTGIVTDRYVIDGTTFEMYDVGGQRNERKKWIHCFDNVTAVLFVASISEYDQSLFEDANTNRVNEALTLFADTCNNKYFQSSSIILLLNKRDLYEAKVKKVAINSVPAFKDYSGPAKDVDAGIKYFMDKFLAQKGSFKKDIYVHVVCATDTQNVDRVFGACKDIILKDSLRGSGFA
ncbi:GPA1, alpha subunit of a heterotrimeric G protein [Tribonema minus]|uniref:GPA1, alpha subunit of a heterotrimeric G protein n=1 Tax=Tribonema minus TaxID=303371 RepID=A0A835YQV5_9STRA|nr:GPA1, alpha subunit of a heterotrimeric G protein [Tribonema minus]|eukprot:TRINITY_DN4246_c0_g3_i1.p1 TRINITY_DN4246_c0_g3~~TRINITY_DN4246_c0_g3_i1.p1  ORF type:complete len:355 (-),score=137.09 TRINITY_DN4246_c0_g3_i1:202-1266(-)